MERVDAAVAGGGKEELVFAISDYAHVPSGKTADDESIAPTATGTVGGEVDATVVAAEGGGDGEDSVFK